VRFLLEDLLDLTPHIQTVYSESLQYAEETLPRFEIDTPTRWRHFFAQTLHETQGYAKLIENLSYSAERLLDVWPRRFPTMQDALPYARNPRALANKVYGGRLGNLNAEDGWIFRGRGFLQITGRSNYQRVSDLLGRDFVRRPDDTLLPTQVLAVAAAIWKDLGANEAADTDDVVQVTKKVNGGTHGLPDRTTWFLRVQGAILDA